LPAGTDAYVVYVPYDYDTVRLAKSAGGHCLQTRRIFAIILQNK